MPEQLPMSTDQPLPGLDDDQAPGRMTELERQVRRSLRFMSDSGLVDERHAGLMQLALELARTIRQGERAYGVAQAAAQLLAVYATLMPEVDGGGVDGFAELRAYLAGVDSRGTSTETRDPT